MKRTPLRLCEKLPKSTVKLYDESRHTWPKNRSKTPPKDKVSPQTRTIAYERTNGICAAGCGRNGSSWHHILPKQRWPELIDEPDNVILVCLLCHSRHEGAFKRLPRSAIRCVNRLVLDEPMRAYIERTYG